MSEFPEFKPIELSDQKIIQKALWEYQPQTSELTFTNLFIWKEHYDVAWSQYHDWLLFIFEKAHCGLPPVGPPIRVDVTQTLLNYLKGKWGSDSRLERVDSRLVNELSGEKNLIIEPTRDQFDYVYRSENLIHLAGRKYHAKRNFLNTFRKTYPFSYVDINETKTTACLEMAEQWCNMRRCEEDMNLEEELQAVKTALNNFNTLGIKGGIIEIDGKVEAFTLGELLNAQTAVIHVEKANPEIRGLYTIINQQFCEHNWSSIPFTNREQDLGEPQLQQAKLSYYPDLMMEKFRVRIKF